MSKIKILAIPPDKHGVGYYRILSPFKHLQDNYPDDFHIDIKYDVLNLDSEFDNYHIVVFHNFIHNTLPIDGNISRIKWLKSKGIKTICDIDDYWLPSHNHPYFQTIVNKKIHLNKIALLKEAEYVSVTTPFFKNTIKNELKLNNIVVFPNAIDENEEQFVSEKIESKYIRFGWLGGSSHLNDLELLRSSISKTQIEFRDKVQFVLCGFDIDGTANYIDKETKTIKTRKIKPEESVWFEYEKIFTSNYKFIDEEYKKYLLSFKKDEYITNDVPYYRRWTENIMTYAKNYNYLDVSLAPLLNNRFNNNKSQLKIIEAGFFKKPIIASDVAPYSIDLVSAYGKNGIYNEKGNALLVDEFKYHKQWYQHMKRLINEPNLREDLGEKLYETVKDTYSLNTVNKTRKEFFKSIINL